MTLSELLQQKMYIHHRCSNWRTESAFTLEELLSRTKGTHIFFEDPELNNLVLGHVHIHNLNIKVLDEETSYKLTYYSL